MKQFKKFRRSAEPLVAPPIGGITLVNRQEEIEYTSEPDALSRCSFLLTWWCDYFPGHPDGEHVVRRRGQAFFADPREHGFPRMADIEDPECFT